MTDTPEKDFEEQLERKIRRIKKAERERPTLFRHSIFITTLGLLFILPVIGGAYLGRWLDGLFSGYSIRWTIGMIVAGVFVGAVNVYLFIRE
jgi:ATP synthase protein I